MNDMRDLYQQLILDHNKSPRNKGPLENSTSRAVGHNPLCGDRIEVALRLDGDMIADIKFEGSGCAISQASASMMTTVLKGFSTGRAQELFEKFHAMLTGDGGDMEQLGKLAALADVYKFPARVKCAMLPWRTLEASLDSQPAMISTE